jgi:two-component sensor histidine kinase
MDIRILCSSLKVETNIDTAIPLGTILTELIHNSIKYAIVPGRPLVIKIELNLILEKYTLKSHDNGPGFSPQLLNSNEGVWASPLLRK